MKCNPVIIIEGPDGAGKSTLALRLSDQFGWPVTHTGGPLYSREEFFARVQAKRLLKTEPVIFDRTPYISEQVYSSLASRPSFVSSLELDYMIEKVRPIVVYCRLGTSAEMVERMLSTPKAHKPPDHAEKVRREHPKIVKRYDQVLSPYVTRPWFVPFNWATKSAEQVISTIEDLLCAD